MLLRVFRYDTELWILSKYVEVLVCEFCLLVKSNVNNNIALQIHLSVIFKNLSQLVSRLFTVASMTLQSYYFIGKYTVNKCRYSSYICNVYDEWWFIKSNKKTAAFLKPILPTTQWEMAASKIPIEFFFHTQKK